MSTNCRRLLLAGLFLVSTSVVTAQEKQPGKATNKDAPRTTQPRTETRTTEPRTGAPATAGSEAKRGAGQLDHFFVDCIRGDNENEIAIAEIGREKASDEQVKAFAEQLVQDHNEFLGKIQKFGGPARVARQPDAGTRTDATRPRTPTGTEKRPNQPNQPNQEDQPNQPDQSSTQRELSRTQVAAVREDQAHGQIPMDQMMQIKDELQKQCLASTTRELNEKQGNEFDKCFVGMQIAAHMKMADTLTVFSKHASPELQKVLNEGLKSTQEHLDHAKKLAKKLDHGSSANRDDADDADDSDARDNN